MPKGREVTKPIVTRVLVADDHPVVRSGLRKLLNSEADFGVVAEVDNGAQAVERAITDDMDLVILDVPMPRRPAFRRRRTHDPQARATDADALDTRERAVPLRGAESGSIRIRAQDQRRQDMVKACRKTMRGEAFLYHER